MGNGHTPLFEITDNFDGLGDWFYQCMLDGTDEDGKWKWVSGFGDENDSFAKYCIFDPAMNTFMEVGEGVENWIRQLEDEEGNSKTSLQIRPETVSMVADIDENNYVQSGIDVSSDTPTSFVEWISGGLEKTRQEMSRTWWKLAIESDNPVDDMKTIVEFYNNMVDLAISESDIPRAWLQMFWDDVLGPSVDVGAEDDSGDNVKTSKQIITPTSVETRTEEEDDYMSLHKVHKDRVEEQVIKSSPARTTKREVKDDEIVETLPTSEGKKTYNIAEDDVLSLKSLSKTYQVETHTSAKHVSYDYDYYSDERLKEDIRDLPESKIMQLKPRIFTQNGKERAFLVADEVEEVFPNAVSIADNGYKAMSTKEIIAHLVKEVQDLRSELEAYKIA